MFSQKKLTSRPKITGVMRAGSSESFYFAGHAMFHVPSGLCLIVKEVEGEEACILSLFNPLTTKVVVSKSMKGYLASCMDLRVVDDSILIKYQRGNDELHYVLLNANTLEEQKVIKDCAELQSFNFSALALGGMKFLSVFKRSKCNPVLMIHDLSELRAVRYSLHHLINDCIQDDDTCKLIALGNNSYALHIANRESTDQHLFTISIDPTGKNLTTEFVNQLVVHRKDDNPYARGCVVGLTDGRQLVYHSGGSNVLVHPPGEKFDQWDWQKVECSHKDFFQRHTSYVREIIPMPDGVHLLVLPLTGLPCHLFNMVTKKLQLVDLGKFDVYTASVSPNGNVVMGGLEVVNANQVSKVVRVVDFPELASFKASLAVYRDRIMRLKMDDFKQLINDTDYWKQKGYKGSRLPKGVALIQALLKKFESVQPFDSFKFIEACKQEALIRLAEGSGANRDMMTTHFYKIFIEDLNPANPSEAFEHLDAIQGDHAFQAVNANRKW